MNSGAPVFGGSIRLNKPWITETGYSSWWFFYEWRKRCAKVLLNWDAIKKHVKSLKKIEEKYGNAYWNILIEYVLCNNSLSNVYVDLCIDRDSNYNDDDNSRNYADDRNNNTDDNSRNYADDRNNNTDDYNSDNNTDDNNADKYNTDDNTTDNKYNTDDNTTDNNNNDE